MNVFRLVKGQLRKPDNTPWPKGSSVQIRLVKGSYTVLTEFPRSGVNVPLDEITGEYSTLLWASETGEIPTRYEAIHPNGERYEFAVPAGAGDLQITVLRQASQSATPAQQNAIFAYVNDAIEAHNADINAHPALIGGGGTQFEFETAQNALIGSPVYLRSDGRFVLANAALPGLSKVDGVAVIDSSSGNSLRAIPSGVIERSNWQQITGTAQLSIGAYYLNPVIPGSLTNIPPQTGYFVEVGKAISATKFFVNPKKPIRL